LGIELEGKFQVFRFWACGVMLFFLHCPNPRRGFFLTFGKVQGNLKRCTSNQKKITTCNCWKNFLEQKDSNWWIIFIGPEFKEIQIRHLMENYQVEKFLGKGTFGTVVLAKDEFNQFVSTFRLIQRLPLKNYKKNFQSGTKF
jgi:hypothetical protein